VSACVWAVFVLFCAGTSLATGLIHVQENLPAVYMIQNLVINRTESLIGQGRRILASITTILMRKLIGLKLYVALHLILKHAGEAYEVPLLSLCVSVCVCLPFNVFPLTCWLLRLMRSPCCLCFCVFRLILEWGGSTRCVSY
jgi:hypothetical protein